MPSHKTPPLPIYKRGYAVLMHYDVSCRQDNYPCVCENGGILLGTDPRRDLGANLRTPHPIASAAGV